MARLTKKHPHGGHYMSCENCEAAGRCRSGEDCMVEAISKLAAYEDSGLAPEQIPRWISVSDQLPEHNQRVIVCRKDGRVEQGFYLGVNGWWKVYGTNTKSITYWMPMPEPPKEGK